MTKLEKDYKEKYGNIPIGYHDRLECLIKRLRKKKRKQKQSIYDKIKEISSIDWKEFSFTIYLLPKATPRPRVNRFRGIFYVEGASDNKKVFRKFLKEHPYPMICTPMKFSSKIYIPPPSSFSTNDLLLAEMGYIRPISKPDFDNVAKTYADMIQGSLIYDDALIISANIEKLYSIKPRIEIKIEYMEEFDCLFNANKIQYRIRKGMKNV